MKNLGLNKQSNWDVCKISIVKLKVQMDQTMILELTVILTYEGFGIQLVKVLDSVKKYIRLG